MLQIRHIVFLVLLLFGVIVLIMTPNFTRTFFRKNESNSIVSGRDIIVVDSPITKRFQAKMPAQTTGSVSELHISLKPESNFSPKYNYTKLPSSGRILDSTDVIDGIRDDEWAGHSERSIKSMLDSMPFLDKTAGIRVICGRTRCKASGLNTGSSSLEIKNRLNTYFADKLFYLRYPAEINFSSKDLAVDTDGRQVQFSMDFARTHK